MKFRNTLTLLILACVSSSACNSSSSAADAGTSNIDANLSAFIAKIRIVDNHSHANTVVPADSDSDALPLDGIPFELPAPLRADNPAWLAPYKALYQYSGPDLSDANKAQVHAAVQAVASAKGDKFPEWVLDQIGTEVLLANRIAMGPGLTSNRFRWVSYVDALLFPLSTKTEGSASPDRAKLFPLEDKLLKRYYRDLAITKAPATLDAYLKTVVTPTLESQRKNGCVAVKFEAAYLRSLDFEDASQAAASAIYARYINGGEATHAEYTTLQDFLFRYIAREAGRLDMSVHLHSFEGFGNKYRAAGADPLLLEPTFNDTTLQKTNFVLIHGGGTFASHAGSLLWKPNVYVDMSMLTLAYTPAHLAEVLRGWLTQYPEKVLFGSDAVALGPDMGWDVLAWTANNNGRNALAMALTTMMRNGEVSRARAQEIATMVLRTNADKLYKLHLKTAEN